MCTASRHKPSRCKIGLTPKIVFSEIPTHELKEANAEIRQLNNALEALSNPFPGHTLLTSRECAVLAQIVRGANADSLVFGDQKSSRLRIRLRNKSITCRRDGAHARARAKGPTRSQRRLRARNHLHVVTTALLSTILSIVVCFIVWRAEPATWSSSRAPIVLPSRCKMESKIS